jgi:DNA-binding NarL/FixJ family response regulator
MIAASNSIIAKAGGAPLPFKGVHGAIAYPAGEPLSEREVEVLQALSKGLTYKEVGGQLGISALTVAAHAKKIYRKLSVHSRGKAVYEATKRGLISLDGAS